MKNNVKVIKRDGSLEDFDPHKIARVVKATGIDGTKHEEIAQKVAEEIYAQKKEKVTSLEIRNLVLTELKKVSQYASGLFEWYEKTKDGHNK